MLAVVAAEIQMLLEERSFMFMLILLSTDQCVEAMSTLGDVTCVTCVCLFILLMLKS